MGYGWWGQGGGAEGYALYWDIRIILEDQFITVVI